MGLWAQLTGQEDASKANKKAAEEQRALYEKARKEEYNATLQSSQLTNALMMSNLSDQMAGKGLTEEITMSYFKRQFEQGGILNEKTKAADFFKNLGDFYNAGGGSTSGRRRRRDASYAAAATNTAEAQAASSELDRISGILGTIT